ncbi:hypothetical protein HUU59_05945 [bacterium]|nr:hypothetical protein [bacterium]
MEHAYAFDVSAYYDPYSTLKVNLTRTGFTYGDCEGNDDRATWISNVANNAEALRWFDELGITNLCVFYDYGLNYDSMLAGTSLKVFNDYRNNQTYRYFEAQHRDAAIASTSDTTYFSPVFGVGSWGSETDTAAAQIAAGVFGTILSIPALDTTDTLFRPAKKFGDPYNDWWGWCREGDCEPLTFVTTIRAKVDSTVEENIHIGDLRFFGSMRGFEDKFPSMWSQGARWVRFGPEPLFSDDFGHPLDFFGTKKYWLTAEDLTFYTDVSDDTPVTTDSWAGPGHSVGYYPNESWVHWGTRWDGGFEYRIMITTTGELPFSVYDIGVSDEAYHQMFESDSSEYYEQLIAQKFIDVKESAGDRFTGWYFDEWNPNMDGPMARVARIVKERAGEACFFNGWETNLIGTGPRDHFYEALAYENTNVEVVMTELYPYQADSTCVPRATEEGFTFEQMLPKGLSTDPNSDSPYLTFQQTTNCSTSQKYDGKKSIQCAFDYDIWGRAPLEALYGIDQPSDSAYRAPLAFEIEHAHERGVKFWVLLESRGDGPRNMNCDSIDCVDRIPSPNEIKLVVWMSAALDADGFMWYWGTIVNDTTSQPQTAIGGLLEYGTSDDFCSPKHVIRTPQYSAAKEAIQDVHEIAPTLEALDFVRTYASRAFETNYPTSTGAPTQADYFYTEAGENPPRFCYLKRIFSSPGEWGQFNSGEFTSDYGADSNYVQVSRFMSPGMQGVDEDYWF